MERQVHRSLPEKPACMVTETLLAKVIVIPPFLAGPSGSWVKIGAGRSEHEELFTSKNPSSVSLGYPWTLYT
jgi:hypothetical protein